MAIPLYVYEFLTRNLDIYLGGAINAKFLVQYVKPCPKHEQDPSTIIDCNFPFCGPEITLKQAYYFLDQFKNNEPRIFQTYMATTREDYKKFKSKRLDAFGHIIPLTINFKQPRKVSKYDFSKFMIQILNNDGFKNSTLLFEHFIKHCGFSHSAYQVQSSFPNQTTQNIQAKYAIVHRNPNTISRKTFNLYLRDFVENNQAVIAKCKYKILKAKSTKIGYYTRKNRTPKPKKTCISE